MTDLALSPFAGVSDWLDQMTQARMAQVGVGWLFVDVLRAGIDQFGGQDRNAVADLYTVASEQLGLSPKTLQNYVSISRKFPPERRPDGVEIGHCNALLGLEDGEADELLHRTVAEGLTVERLRQIRFGDRHNDTAPDEQESLAEWLAAEQDRAAANEQEAMDAGHEIRAAWWQGYGVALGEVQERQASSGS